MKKLLEEESWRRQLFSNGWREGLGGVVEVLEPATGECLTTSACASAQDMDDAVVRARQAQAGWAAKLAPERAAVLRRAGDLLIAHLDEVQAWLRRETGSVRAKAEWEVRGAAADFHNAAALTCEPVGSLLSPRLPGQLSLARRLPLGVVGVITPWNSPLVLATRVLAPALAAGNAVVLKPDMQSPVSGGAVLVEILRAAGLPEGIFHMLPGAAEAGEALCRHQDIAKVSFTGSTATGRRVAALCGQELKRVSLELGGNNAFIVMEDADVEVAARAAAFGSYFHQGQICFSIGRHLVHESLHDAYVDALTRVAKRLVVGNPIDDKVQVGPLINERQCRQVDVIVQETVSQGARLVLGGTHEGLFYAPTVLTGVTPEMPAFAQEIFGPVAPVTSFRDRQHAIALANQSDYGLAVAIQTGVLEQGLAMAEHLRVGIAHINDQTIVRGGDAPIGGEGHSGNGGRAGHLVNLDEWTYWQWATARAQGGDYAW